MPKSSSKRERRREEKRREILKAATAIFLEEGFGRTNMDRVLGAIGGSKRTLYNHFKSKEELFKAIVTDVSDRALAALTPDLDSDDVQQMLTKMGAGYLTVLTSAEGIALYRAMVAETPHFPELSATFFKNGPGRATRHLAAFLRVQKRAGRLDIGNAELDAALFLGMVRGDIHLAAVLNEQSPTNAGLTKAARAAVKTFLEGRLLRRPHSKA